MKRLLLLLACLTLSLSALAHKSSDSYLNLSVDGNTVTGQWDIALRDLDFAMGLDRDSNGEITWGEVRARHGDIAAYALSRLQVGTGGASCPASVTDHLIDTHTDGTYAVLRFSALCAAPVQTLALQYSLLFDLDPQHKGLLQLRQGDQVRTGIFAPDRQSQDFDLEKTDRLSAFVDYVREGVWHIWIGYDHILFLLALLLPAVMVRESRAWRAAQAFRPVFWTVLKIVTAFTVAHSITLTLATLGIVTLPSRLVESVIAASVVVAALNNVFPLFSERRWIMAFLFGLIHGFGFASVLSDLGLPQQALAVALVGFNLGVELGQLAIVAAFLPVAFLLRRSGFYRYVVLAGGSVVIAVLALIWLIERALDITLLG